MLPAQQPQEKQKLKTHTRTRIGAATLLLATALTLTACGGDSDSDGKDKIDGADATTASASPSATPSDDGIDRPEITLPKDVHNVFEGGKTGDPQKDAVLADNERRLNSIDEIITSGDLKRPGLKFYSKGTALGSATTYVQGFLDENRSFTGTTRYYDRKVALLKEGQASPPTAWTPRRRTPRTRRPER
ncbi:hypothetical protein NKH77_23285 [Streptomyces sp. M19]